MGRIRTLLGEIKSSELGITYSHEHLYCTPYYWVEKNQEDLLLDNYEHSLQECMDLKKTGVKSIVDATAVDYGRDVNVVANIAKETGLHIIGTAGFNKNFLWSAKIPDKLYSVIPSKYETFLAWIEDSSIESLRDFVISEVEEGMEGTSYLAGQIKFGTGYNCISSLEIKTIHAIVQAHKIIHAPIHSHTEFGTMALEQIEILQSEGIDLSAVCFGHMDRNPDPYYHQKVANTGAYLSFDGIGKIKYAPESTRISNILDLCRKGFEKQIVISGDTARKSYYKSYKEGLGLSYIWDKWVPRFKDEAQQAGFDAEYLIKCFFIDNPARCFSFKE